jgi:predicted nucleic acid-binding protein
VNFVLDASITMSWLLRDGKPAANDYAREVLDAVVDKDMQPIVPVTWGLEVANVIAKAEARELITEAQSEAFLEMLNDLGILVDFETFPKALSETLQLARRYRLSAYDSSYLEVALREGLGLATLDDDLRKAAKKAGVAIFGV